MLRRALRKESRGHDGWGLGHAHFVKGLVLAYLRRAGEAVANARRAVEINQNFADAHMLRGFALTNAGARRKR